MGVWVEILMNTQIFGSLITQTHDIKFKAPHLPFNKLIRMACLPARHTAFKLYMHFSILTEM